MRTTLDLPNELYREAKMRAVEKGTTFKSLMTEYIRSGLREPGAEADGRPVRRSPPPVAIRREAGRARTPPLSNAQLNNLLEDENVRASRRAAAPSEAEK